MACRLKIVFSGLCLFVPDERQRIMHVLLPDSAGHEEHGVKPHFARLYYDKGHRSAGGTLTGRLQDRKLKDRALIVPKDAPDAETRLVEQIVDLGPVAGKPIDPEQVRKKPKKVSARVTLRSGSITACAPGTYWEFNGRPVCMTNMVDWTVPIPGDSIVLDLEGINSGTDGKLEELHKIGDEIVLLVYNAAEDDQPGGTQVEPRFPGKRHEARHFTVYYDVYPTGAGRANPFLLSEEGTCPAGTEELVAGTMGRRGPRGADPYQCMVAAGRMA